MAESEQVTVTFEDDGSARGIAQGLVNALDQVFSRSLSGLGDRLEKPFKDMATSAKKASKTAKDSMDDIFASMQKTTKGAEAFAKTMEGLSRTNAKAGGILDPDTFDATRQSFVRLDENIDRVIRNFDRLSATAGGRQVLGDLTAAIRSQANQANIAQQSITRIAETGAKARIDAANNAAKRITAAETAASKERIVAAQQEGAQALAATRAATQRRVELFRAAVNQIRALERGLGTVFSTTARGLGSAFSGIGRTISSALSRSNREMTQGLQSSLTTRQNIISRSFRTQEQTISSSITRQTAQLDRLERELSTGVTGFATGRSAAANALGVGGGILAGAGLVKVLKDGFTAGADFTAGLAVLDAQLQLTDEQMASVRKTALDLGNDISLPGVSALDAAQAIQQLAKQFGNLGVEAPAAATAAAKGVLQLSRATGSSSEDAAQVVGAAINVFKVQAAEAGLVADQVANALSKAAGTSFTDFAAAFKQGATVFAQFQVPALGAKDALLEFNTALAVMAQGGLVGSDAGTSIRSFFLQANRGAKESEKALALISERAGVTGTAFFEADGDARGLGETLTILRAGLEGLSDQERSERLFTLFGSDAVRAAEILTNTTGPAFDAMRDQLRRQGTAAELAAAQNQGLRGALDALGSTIETQLILAYEKFQIVAGNAVLVFANLFNNLASGEGVFAAIRTGLKGLAVGLGGLLGIKLIAEGFGLLRVALLALLTPLGATIAAFAAAGAGIALLLEHSEGARKIFDDIKLGFKAMVDTFRANDPNAMQGDGIVGFFQRLGGEARQAFNFIGDQLIPKIQELAGVIKNFAVDIFTSGDDDNDAFLRALIGVDQRSLGDKIGDFIRSLVGPVVRAFQTAFSFVRDAITGSDNDDLFLMALTGSDTRTAGEKFGDRVREIFGTARDAIVGFAQDVQKFVQPAVNVLGNLAGALVDIAKANPTVFFTTLGAAIAGGLGGLAVGGPLGGIIGAAGGGLGALFAQGFGDEIVGGLQDIGQRILEGLQAGLGAAGGALSRVFAVDNLIDFGLFATELAQRLGRVLGNVLSDPRLVAGAAGVAGFAALAAARFVIGFGQGVISNVPELARLLGMALEAALKGAISFVASNPLTFATAIAGLLIGRQALSAFRGAGQKAGQEVQRGMLATFASNSTLGRAFAGGGGVVGGGGRSFITGLLGGPDALSNAIRDQTTRAVSTAQRETARLNAILASAGRGITRTGAGPDFAQNVRNAYDQLIKDVGPAGVRGLQLRSGIQAAINSLRSLSARPLIDFFRNMGVTAGQAFGTALKGAASVGAGAIAGFQTGQALAGQSGLTQALGVGGLALTLGAINPALGIAAGLAGAAGIAFGNMGKSAEAAAGRINLLEDAILAANDAGELIAGVGAQILSDLEKSFDTGELEGLRNIQFDFDGLVERVTQGTATIRDEFDRFARASGPAGAAFVAGLAPSVDTVEELNRALLGTRAGGAFRDELESIGFEAGDAEDMMQFLKRTIGEYDTASRNAAAGGGFSEDLQATADAAGEADPKVRALIDALIAMNTIDSALAAVQIEAVKIEADEARAAMDLAKAAADDFLNGTYGDTLQSALDNITTDLPSIESQLTGLGDVPVAVADAIRRQVGDRINVDLRAAIAVGLETGEITNPGEFLTSLRTLVQAQIDTGQIPATAGAALIAEIDSLLASPTFAADMASLMQGIVDNGVPPVVPAPFTLDPVPTLAPDAQAKLDAAIGAAIAGGAATTGPLGFSRGGAAGGGGKVIDVPMTVNPVITVSADYGANLAAALANLRNTGAKPGTIDVLMTVNPIITISPNYGANLAAALATLRNTGAKPGVINVPMTINPIFTVAGSATGAALAVGIRLGQFVAAGISSGTGAVGAAAAVLVRSAVAIMIPAAVQALAAGAAFSARFAAGIRGGLGVAVAAARAIAASSVAAAASASAAAAAAGRAFASAYAAGIRGGSGAAIGAARALGAAASAAVRTSTGQAQSAGAALGAGLAAGIRASTGAAVGAARSMAAQVAAASRSALQIASPSRVFMDIGREIGRGLAQGIADSEGDITSAARSAVDAVVKASSTRAEQIASASSSLFDLLQPGGLNNVSAAEQVRNTIGLTTMATDLQKVFDDAAVALWDSVSNPTTAQQRMIRNQFTGYGLGFQSLNTGAILGSQNAAGFLDIAERISDFIRTQLAAGDDVRAVTSQARGYVDQLRAVSAQYGASSAEVEHLLASLGLTDSAMAQLVAEVDALRAEASRTVPASDPEAAKAAEEEAKRRDEEAKKREEQTQALMLELLRIAVAKPTSVEVSIPYGDPEAVALATMNRIADSLSV
ncbi:MAG: phage tail tape measure protein family [Thermomicrobiales bacterium]|jgi:TP901 family phage tail tape measure protein|nr:phage tail tape measure protein family [Thermomicrobiales bacterium]MDF3014818.1 phage tail tape measure protein family [Thermomicrobiales bacterium]